MQRSSETIGAIAAALAKAQTELTNPEKSLVGIIGASSPREPGRSFRYAPLSSGLDIARKSLGRHSIAIVQTTAIDKEAGLVQLNTALVHSFIRPVNGFHRNGRSAGSAILPRRNAWAWR